MIRSLTLAALACLSAVFARGQQCGFDEAHKQMLAQNPAYAARVQAFTTQWIQSQQMAQNSLAVVAPGDTTYEIPVVIHVVRPVASAATSTYNPTDAQLIGMIDYVNQVYAGTYYQTGGNGVRFPVRFVLAKRDSACGSTTGIIRVDGSGLPGYASGGVAHSGTTGASEASIKALSRWNNNDYYNIWVVNKIDGQDGLNGGTYTAGYAYFPGAGDLDGTIMLASSSHSNEITLPHELGHAFNLYHTFQGDQDAQGNSICPSTAGGCAASGDFVCDTEPHKRNLGTCPSGTINSCTNAPYSNAVAQNVMNYTSCTDFRFTVGQRTRWVDALRQQRPGLMTSMGGVAPATNAAVAACVPTTSTGGNFDAGPSLVKIQSGTSVLMAGQTAGGYVSDGNRALVSKTCTHQVRAWIDYNNNGTFDATEELSNLQVPFGGQTTYGGTFTVPAGAATCVPLRMRVVADVTTGTVTACGPFSAGQAEDYTVYVKSTTTSATVAFAPGSANPSCNGTPLSFTASTTAINPNITWYVNSTAVQNGGTTYANSGSLANGDVVRVKVNFTGSCGADSVFSNGITVVRTNLAPARDSIKLIAGSIPTCVGQTLTFEVTPYNGGTNPTYQWQTGTTQFGTYTNVVGATGTTFSSSTLPNNTYVRCRMTSNSACLSSTIPPVSNTILVTYGTPTVDVTIAQTAGPNPACLNKTVSFTATPVNGGTSPAFQWLLNGVPVAGATGTTFTYQPTSSDLVQAELTSSNPCATKPKDTSTGIILTVLPVDTARLDIALTKGSNPGCSDSVLEYTATTANMGNPFITWYLNGTATQGGATFSSSTVQDGDVLTARAIANGPGCRDQDTVYSTSVTLSRKAAPAPPAISFINGNLIANQQNVQWWGPNGAFAIAGATSQTYHPTVAGLYYATAMNSDCPSLPSNKLQVSLLAVGTLDLSNVAIFPNPTTGTLTIDWSHQAAAGSLDLYTALGQHLIAAKVDGQATKTLDLGLLPNGTYFLVVRNAAGEASTVPVTLRR